MTKQSRRPTTLSQRSLKTIDIMKDILMSLPVIDSLQSQRNTLWQSKKTRCKPGNTACESEYTLRVLSIILNGKTHNILDDRLSSERIHRCVQVDKDPSGRASSFSGQRVYTHTECPFFGHAPTSKGLMVNQKKVETIIPIKALDKPKYLNDFPVTYQILNRHSPSISTTKLCKNAAVSGWQSHHIMGFQAI